MSHDRRPPGARRLAFLVAVFGVAIVGARGANGVLDGLALAGLLVLVPVLARKQLDVLGSDAIERVPAYLSSALSILLLSAVTLPLGVRAVGLEGMGLGSVGGTTTALWTLGLVGAGLVVVAGFHLAARGPESRILRELLPRTPLEKATFVGLSGVAGVGEEVAYRGYAIPVLTVVTGHPVVATLVSAAGFGAAHAYQGLPGMVRAGLLGLILSTPLVVIGSLWPAIFAHAILDVVGGLLLGPLLTGADDEPPGEER